MVSLILCISAAASLMLILSIGACLLHDSASFVIDNIALLISSIAFLAPYEVDA